MAKKTKEQLELEQLIASQSEDISMGSESIPEYISKDAHHRDQDPHGQYHEYESGGIDKEPVPKMSDTYVEDTTGVNENYAAQLKYERQAQMEEVENLTGSITESRDLEVGGETPYDAQLKRFRFMEASVQLRAAAFLEDPLSQEEIYAGSLGTQKEENQTLLETRNAFASVIGGDVERFVKELRTGVAKEQAEAGVGRTTVKTAYSMLAKTAESFSVYGSSDYGEEPTQERKEAREAREADARVTALHFAESYVNPNLPEGPMREKAVVDNYDFIIKRAMEQKTSTRMVTDVTGQQLYTTETVPVLDKKGNLVLDVEGQPSYEEETRPMVASGAMPLAHEMPGLGNLPQYNEFSPRQSLFNENIYGKEKSNKLYQEDLLKYKQMVSTIRQQTTTLSDEFHGNRERYVGQGISHKTEWAEKGEYLNEAMLFELQRESSDTSHSQAYATYLEEGGGKGSSTGGMYGEKGKSEADIYVDARVAGHSADDALLMTRGFDLWIGNKEVNIDDELRQTAFSGISDREKYQARITAYPQPEQGSQEWLDQRVGHITGSTTLSVNAYDKTIERRAQELVDPTKARKVFQTPAMREGTAMEPTVNKYLTEFLTGNLDENLVRVNQSASIGKVPDFREKVAVEEAFFETTKELPGFSVSPDGFVFNEKGESMGLAEFKYHQEDEELDKIDPKYMRQMQMQMAVTKEKGVHFFRMSKAGEFAYDYITPNKELQSALIKTNRRALDRAEEIKKGGPMAISHAEMKDLGGSDASVYEETSTIEQEATVFGAGMSTSSRNQQVINSMKDVTVPARAGQNVEGYTFQPDTTMMKEARAEDKAFGKKKKAEEDLSKAMVKEANEDLARTAKLRTDADKEAAQASKQFSAKLKEAGTAAVNLISTLAGLGIEGSESQMADVRLGAKTGLGTDEARSMRDALVAQGGMTAGEAQRSMMQVSSLQSRINDPYGSGVQIMKSMTGSLISAGLGDLGFNPISMSGKDTQASMAMIMDAANRAKTPDERKRFLDIVGASDLATASASGQVTGETLTTVTRTVDESTARKVHEDLTELRESKREGKEVLANVVGGTALGIGEGVSTAAGLMKNTLALTALTGAVLANTVAHGGGKGLSNINKLAKGGGALALAPLAAGVGLAGALGHGLSQTLEHAEMRKDFDKVSDEERAEIAELNAHIKAPSPSDPNYLEKLAEIGRVNHPNPEKAKEDKTNVNNEVTVNNYPDRTETEIKCNGKTSKQVQMIQE